MSKGDIYIFLSNPLSTLPVILMGIQGGEPLTQTPPTLEEVHGGTVRVSNSLKLERGNLESEPTPHVDGWETATSTSLLTSLSPAAFEPSEITSTYYLAKQTPLLTLHSPSSHCPALPFIAGL